MMPSKTTKRISRKEKQKIKDEADNIVISNTDKIERVSPFYDFINKREQKPAAYNRLLKVGDFTKNIPSYEEIDINEIHNDLVDGLKRISAIDIEIHNGLIDNINKQDEFYKVVAYIIAFCDAKNKYFTLKKIQALDFISNKSRAIIMHDTYYQNDETESEWTYKIGEICFASNIFDYATILDKIEYEMLFLKNQQGENIKIHFCYSEVKQLQKLIEIGEPFSVYRGVLIKPEEMIRGTGKRTEDLKSVEEDYVGRKSDGDEFYRNWNAGKGVSLTLTKETAYFFCYWNLHKRASEINYKLKSEELKRLTRIIEPLRTKEEILRKDTIITSEMIDAVGLNPVVIELTINPKEIVGAKIDKGEGEVNILPENCKVKHYELVNSASIAENCYNTSIRRTSSNKNLLIPFDKNGITCLVVEGKPIFADGSKIYERIDAIKNELQEGKASVYNKEDELINLYRENEIRLPKNIRFDLNATPTKTFYEWLKNPVKKMTEVKRSKKRGF